MRVTSICDFVRIFVYVFQLVTAGFQILSHKPIALLPIFHQYHETINNRGLVCYKTSFTHTIFCVQRTLMDDYNAKI